jgi:hypothetical protein
VLSKSRIFNFLKRDCGTIPVAKITSGKIEIFSKHQRFLIGTESSKYLLIFVLYVCVILCEFGTATGCPKNGVLTVHYGVEEITVNARKMSKKFHWTYFLIWRSLNVALNRSIILKYMYEIVMTATSHRTYYHKVQDHSLSISNPA